VFYRLRSRGAYTRLEPDDGKLSSPVLRGGSGSNAVPLPDPCGWGAGGVAGGALFQPAALPPSRGPSTALGGIAADAVASGLRLDDLHSAAVAGVGAVAVLHGGPRCGD